MMLLEGADVLIFTDDISVQNNHVRKSVCRDMEWCGIHLDEALNVCTRINCDQPSRAAQSKNDPFLAMPTDEEGVIAEEGSKLWTGGSNVRH